MILAVFALNEGGETLPRTIWYVQHFLCVSSHIDMGADLAQIYLILYIERVFIH